MFQKINREAGDKAKGFRLQKLRAIELLLKKMSEKDNIAVFAATEFQDDVYYTLVKEDGSRESYAEGDKNYNPNSSFSFSAPEVRNSLVILLDCWIDNGLSQSLYFGFYTNVKYGREYSTDRLKQLGVFLPDKPLFELIIVNQLDYPNVLDCMKKILIDEYENQYGGSAKNVAYVKRWTESMWRDFFGRIDWQFQQADEKELELKLHEDIINLNFSNLIPGQEKTVLALLEHEFEKRQGVKDNIGRLVTGDKVETICFRVSHNVAKRQDPIYKHWEALQEPTDKRNLELKIAAVCSNYPRKRIGILARKIGSAKLELEKSQHEFSSAFRYRLYLGCEERLDKLLEVNGENLVTSIVIDKWFEELFVYCKSLITDKSKDYAYELTSDDLILSTIYELFDACYLAFDEGENDGT